MIKKFLILIFISFLLTACNFGDSSDSTSGGGLFSSGKKVNNKFSITLPASKTLTLNDVIDISLIHPANLTVSGSPQIEISIGAATVQANYLTGSGTRNLTFRYTVQTGDNDLDGIGFSNTISLNGGTISYTESGASVAVNTNLEFSSLPTLIIQTSGPTISSLIEPINGTYADGSNILLQVNFSEPVIVSGSPRIRLNIGGNTRFATYSNGTTTSGLEFSYTVQAGENDSDGIQITGDSIELNSGSIKNGSLETAFLDFSDYKDSTSGVIVNTSSGITAPAQVQNLSTAPTTSNTTLALAWSKPANNGTSIIDYTVQYRQQGQSSWQTKSPNPTSNSTTVGSLSAGVTYEFRVAANNGLLGDFSTVANAEIFDVMSLNPIAWLDATNINGDGTSPSDGTKIDVWVDLTGAATNATELTPANQPEIQYNAQNGLPSVRFNNHSVGLEGTFTRSIGTDLTFIVVGQFDSGSTDKCLFEFKGPGSERGFFIDRRYASNTYYSPALTKGSFQIWRIEDNGTNAQVTENSSTILFNGGTYFGTDFIGSGTYVLGDDATGGNRMNGYISEFLIFDKALSPSEIATIEAYLKSKWGTP